MNNCPHCNRVLLSRASVRCNWCGAEIQDSAFLEQAQSEREAYFAHQREHDALSASRIDAINMNVNDQWSSGIPYSPSLAATRKQRMAEAAILRAQTEAARQQAPVTQQDAYSQQTPPVPQNPYSPQTAPSQESEVRKEYKANDEHASATEEPTEAEPKPKGRFGHLEF